MGRQADVAETTTTEIPSDWTSERFLTGEPTLSDPETTKPPTGPRSGRFLMGEPAIYDAETTEPPTGSESGNLGQPTPSVPQTTEHPEISDVDVYDDIVGVNWEEKDIGFLAEEGV